MESKEKLADTAAVLAEARFFSGLDGAQLARVAALGRARSFPQDTRIYTVGDAVDDFYVLADGMVRFTLGLGKRDTAAGDIIRRGDVFGWAPLVEGHARRIATAYCLTALRGHRDRRRGADAPDGRATPRSATRY